MIETVTDPINLLSALAAVLFAVTAYTLISPAFEGDKVKKRMKTVTTEREELRKRHLDSLNKDSKALRHNSQGKVKDIVDKLSLERLLEDPKLKDKLAEAGIRGQRPIYVFYFMRMLMPIALFIVGGIYVFMFLPEWDLTRKMAAIMVATFAGYYLPGLFLKNKAKKRQSAIGEAWPDALDLLLICVESGMSVEAAFKKVAQEVSANSIELAEELSLTTAELSYLQSRRIAYENLSRRTGMPQVHAVCTALIQAERYGTPLGHALRTMAKENRELRITNAEKKAGALPAKLTVPMIVFFLPVLFIVILTPAYIKVKANFSNGSLDG